MLVQQEGEHQRAAASQPETSKILMPIAFRHFRTGLDPGQIVRCNTAIRKTLKEMGANIPGKLPPPGCDLH